MLKCRTEEAVFAEVIAKHNLQGGDIIRAIKFLLFIGGIQALNRQDGRAILPSGKGLQYLASHRAAYKGGIEQQQLGSDLSDQAASILRQFVESGGSDLFYRDWGEGQFTLQIDNLGPVGVTEPRFIQGDLDQLVALDLLRTEFASDGNPIYHITRKSARFIANRTLLPEAEHTPALAETPGGGEVLHPGQSFGQWILQEPIGQGGNGVVWSANNSNNRPVAIKFLQSEHFGQQCEQRFRDEIEFLRRESNRPGILPLIDYYLPEKSGLDDRPWFTTPFAQCFTKLSLAGSANLEKLVADIEVIAQTLAKLHDEGKWHRDLKPDNLFILDAAPVIGDFGLVHFPGKEANTRDSEHLGSRNYTAPELEGDAGDTPAGPADVYSLAKTFWVLASGKRHPPAGQLRMDIPELRFSQLCPHPRAGSLDFLLERGTNHAPLCRPTMQQFGKELSEWLHPPTTEPKISDLSVLPNDYQSAFELADRARRKKEELIDAAKTALASCEPILAQIAAQVSKHTKIKAYVANAFDLEAQQFIELAGGLRLVWRGAREVRVTIGEIWAVYFQSFVQVEAIEDDTIRIVAGHFIERTAHGQRFIKGVNRDWMKEVRALRGTAQLQNELGIIRGELLKNLGSAIQRFGEHVIALQKRN